MWTMYENFYRKWVYGPHPVYSDDLEDPLQTTTCFTGDSKESIFSTLLIHSTYLGRQRIQAVESLKSNVTKVCRGSFQEWGAQHYQNLTLEK